MFRNISTTELLLVLAVIVLLFGVGRIGKIAKELGGGIRSFKDGLQGKDETKPEEKEEAEKKEN